MTTKAPSSTNRAGDAHLPAAHRAQLERVDLVYVRGHEPTVDGVLMSPFQTWVFIIGMGLMLALIGWELYHILKGHDDRRWR